MRQPLTILLVTLALSIGNSAGAVMPELSPISEHPRYERARRLVKEQQYSEAIQLLDTLQREFRDAADLYNLLGFAHRKRGNYDRAKEHYDRALALEPEHLSANEYLGEWFVEMGDLVAARERLAVLQHACGQCEEHEDLAKAIASAEESRR